MKMEGIDPRSILSGEALDQAARPAPQASGRATNSRLGMIAFTALGIVGLIGFIALYKPTASPTPTTEFTAATQIVAATPPTPDATEPLPLNVLDQVTLPATLPAQPLPPNEPTAVEIGAAHQPVLIFDNSNTTSVERTLPLQPDTKTASSLGSNAQFALKMSGGSVAHAMQIGDQSALLLQGTLISAILETAINSDLPGYVRAVVSSEVRSADGSHVLIPRGSRLIGQYKSALSTGETRVMIVWDRLLRPDGVSV